MKNILNISFPRSGHHLLVNCLTKYFSQDILFDQTSGSLKNDEIIRAGEFAYCEFYNHCRKIPCVEKEVNFQKNHDLGLFKNRYQKLFNIKHPELSIDNRKSYIIQFRNNPYESIISEYLRNIETQSFKKRNINDTYDFFLKFSLDYLEYWNKFNQKWVLNAPKNAFIFSYESFIKNPKSLLTEVLQFINANEINHKRIEDIVDILDINYKSDITEFKYYNNQIKLINRNYKFAIKHEINSLPENLSCKFFGTDINSCENELSETESSLKDFTAWLQNQMDNSIKRISKQSKSYNESYERTLDLISDVDQKIQEHRLMLNPSSSHSENLRLKILQNQADLEQLQTMVNETESISSHKVDSNIELNVFEELAAKIEKGLNELLEKSNKINDELKNQLHPKD